MRPADFCRHHPREPGFAGARHIRILFIDASIVGLIALGQTFVIITGGIDLSIPWTVNSAAVFLTLLSSGHDAAMASSFLSSSPARRSSGS